MARPRAQSGTSVPIDGVALRRIRIERGLEVAVLARRLRISRSYLTKLELGHSPRASATVHAALVRLLRPADPDAFRTDLLQDTGRTAAGKSDAPVGGTPTVGPTYLTRQSGAVVSPTPLDSSADWS